MTKRQAIWVLIRACGVYFLYQAALALYGFVSAALWSIWSFQRTPLEGAGPFVASALGLTLLQALILAVIGLYLLKGGQFIFDLINFETEVDTPEEPWPPSISQRPDDVGRG